MRKYTNGKVIVTAKNYKDAANKIYGNSVYPNPLNGIPINTLYVNVHGNGENRHAEVREYSIGDKQCSYWGVNAAIPKTYIIVKI